MERYPESLTEWKVDEVIECLPVEQPIIDALLYVAPLAYMDTGIPLADVWPALSEAVQVGIAEADQQNRRELGYALGPETTNRDVGGGDY